MDDNYNEELKILLQKLLLLQTELYKVGEITGANKNAKIIAEEIKELGWTNIVNKYHPDCNMHDLASHHLFEMYKFIKDNIDRFQD